jgi:predicted dehydrogenase
MGQRHARVLLGLERRFDVVGGYDVRGEVPTPAGVARLRSEAEALARAEVLVVATPIETHGGLVTRALAAGKHVLVEKPICATAMEAHAALVAARSGARLFVGHSERFNPVVRSLARLLRSERVTAIALRRIGPCRPCGCGVLVNLGVHDLDLAAYLGGGGVALHGAVGARVSLGPGEDFAHVLFSTAGGALGHVVVDRTVPVRQRAIEVSTDRWIYEGDLLAHRLVRTARTVLHPGGRTGTLRPPSPLPVPLDEPLRAQASALADALDGAPVREIATASDGVRALELAEQAAAWCAGGAASTSTRDPSAENLSVDSAH